MLLSPKKKSFILLLLFSLFVFSACFDDDSSLLSPELKPEITGTWLLPGFAPYEEKWVIVDNRITYYSGTVATDTWSTTNYIGEIVQFNNIMFNAGESETSDCGYAVIRFIYADNAAWGDVDKYNIFRWKNLTTSNVSFSQGTKLIGTYPNSTNQIFNSVDDAVNQATDAAGYFGYYSSNVTNI